MLSSSGSKPDYPHSVWRLIKTPPRRGAWNMAVDEALLESIDRDNHLPVLRLYAWDPPCLSLGYAQHAADVDRERLESYSWDLVRRPTGGKAILHTDELTYSVIGPATDPRLAGSILESYQRLAEALLAALHSLGIPAQINPELLPASERAQAGPVCFEVPSSYEITLNGKKLIGSAQARRKEGVLQHGSLPLFGDLERITQVLVFPDESERRQSAQRLKNRAMTAEEALDCVISWEDAAQAFREAFKQTLNLELQESELTAEELRRADELIYAKYANPSWTNRL